MFMFHMYVHLRHNVANNVVDCVVYVDCGIVDFVLMCSVDLCLNSK